MNEQQLLHAARDGDEDAFARLIAPHRRELYAHCYRMLGLIGRCRGRAAGRSPRSLARAAALSRGAARFDPGCTRSRPTPACRRSSADPGACSRSTTARPRTRTTRWLSRCVESAWIEPLADSRLAGSSIPDARYEEREAVELAFIAAIQHLPARQRAVLLLRDVLGFSARETAEALDATPVSIDSALQRAHKTVDARLPERSQQETLRSLDDRELRRIVEGFVMAWERADIDAIVAMLAEDAVLAMPPEPTWFAGRDAIAAFLAATPLAATTPATPARAHLGQRPDRVRPLQLARGAQRVHAPRHHRAVPAPHRALTAHLLPQRRCVHGVRSA